MLSISGGRLPGIFGFDPSHLKIKIINNPKKIIEGSITIDTTPLERNSIADPKFSTIYETFSTLNYPLPRWPISEKQGLNNNKGKVPLAERALKLQKCGLPLDIHAIEDLLKAAKKLKSLVPASPLPKIFSGKASDRPFIIELFERTDKVGREIIFSFFDNNNKISSGSFKVNYHAWPLTGQPLHLLYAKSNLFDFKEKKISEDCFKIAIREAFYLNLLRDSTIAPRVYKCYYHDSSQDQALIMEYIPFSLFERLIEVGEIQETTKTITLSDRKKLQIAIDTAKAIRYLHSLNIVHRDLKPENILLNQIDGDPRICDFGFSFHTSCKQDYFQKIGSPEYTAPEVLTFPKICSERQFDNLKSEKMFALDIWGLGCILWVLFTHTTLVWYPNMKDTFWAFKYLNEIKRFNQCEPDKQKSPVAHLVWSILAVKPGKRPAIQTIITKLEELLGKLPQEETTDIYSEFNFE
jgi:serine/threonine protein kinase